MLKHLRLDIEEKDFNSLKKKKKEMSEIMQVELTWFDFIMLLTK